VKKKDINKHTRGTSAGREVVRDWGALFTRLRDAIDWALDFAARIAADNDDEVRAIERARGYAHAWLEGRRVNVVMSDVWTTLAVLFSEIEIDTGIDSAPFLTPLRGLPSVIHLPGAARDELPTVAFRRFPRRRNACGAITQLVA
jgi:hypothetical protein